MTKEGKRVGEGRKGRNKMRGGRERGRKVEARAEGRMQG